MDGKVVKKKANVCRLKPYLEREKSEAPKQTHPDSPPVSPPPNKRRKVDDEAQKKKCQGLSPELLRVISERKELTDEHIQFAQQLLHTQFPTLDGLQLTVLSQNNGFCPVSSESIQIHHTGKFHWVTSCSIGGHIAVYDSKYTVGDLSPSLQVQLAQIYRLAIQEEDGDKCLEIKVPAVQQQRGKVDCGVFAVAYAFHAARGDDLRAIEFQQDRMRSHLLQCFKNKRLSPFPHTIRDQPWLQTAFPWHEIEIFCSCNLPEVYDNMVQCDQCEDWFHLCCEGLKSPPESDVWHCSTCS